MHVPGSDRYHRVRRWVYRLLESPEVETGLERFVRIFIASLIVLNVTAVIIETVNPIYREWREWFIAFEIFSVAVFSTEYVLRLWAIVEEEEYSHPVWGRLRYSVTFFALVDLLAILPFYLGRFAPIDLREIRILRLLRLARVLKLGRYSKAFRMFIDIARDKKELLTITVGVIFLLLIVSSSVIYYLEHEAQPEVFSSIPAALWWGIVTLTTIGYGDVYPITPGGKLFAAVIAVLSVGLVALPSGVIVSGFVEVIEKEQYEKEKLEEEAERLTLKQPKFCPHCGERLKIE